MTEEYVVATQQTIGTLITKPKMADKYLKKPPFRLAASRLKTNKSGKVLVLSPDLPQVSS